MGSDPAQRKRLPEKFYQLPKVAEKGWKIPQK